MPRQVLVGRIQGGPPETLLLDIDSGQAVPSGLGPEAKTRGVHARIEGHAFALYAFEARLVLQWDGRRWPLSDDAVRLAYRHDFARKLTIFSVDGQSFEYPAWWREDPTFEPLEPERDEAEDFLGYVMAVQRDPGLQRSLLQAWGGRKA